MKAKVNALVKGISGMIKSDKSDVARFEHDLAYASNTKTQRVFSGRAIRTIYDRYIDELECEFISCGYSKKTFCCVPKQDGTQGWEESKYIVIKRMNPPTPSWWTGEPEERLVDGKNQLVQEIRCWERFADMPESDMLCPILKWGFQQGDKFPEGCAKVCDTVYIVAYKACFVGDLKEACVWAERQNNDKGYHGTPARDRLEEIRKFSDDQGWWDVWNGGFERGSGNSGNCGVIFDPIQNCYKAVIIDYAL